ncbi:MAG: LysM peptidoglycan-binding domain-containing protein [Crocinitomicaceae bacterium]|nr:LysM peptidoglycan-binding domain-containing protein [Crocinitomicaceae bacterium]
MYRLLILFLFFISFSAMAQPGVANVVEIEGQKFYEHKVETGNTLWGMQSMYGVPYQEIVEANPGFDGLKEGEIVLVPIKEVETPEVTSEYKVKNRETLYGLSRKFNTTVDKLIELNPSLATEGLKKHQIIKVPGAVSEEVEPITQLPEENPLTPNPFVVDTLESGDAQSSVVLTFSDSTIQHTVLPNETMYKISKRFMVSIEEIMKLNDLRSTAVREGQILTIPVKNERVDRVDVRPVLEGYNPDSPDSLQFEEKPSYNVAILIPLHLEFGPGYSERMSELATQFYMGATLAVDSLEKMGLNANVHIFDTKNDSATIAGILNSPDFTSMDVIIGPLMNGNAAQVASYCKANKVRMVCPVPVDSDVLEENRLVYATVPSRITLIRGLAKYMLEHKKGERIILIKPLDKESQPLYDAFRTAFLETEVIGNRPSLIETTLEGFSAHMSRSSNNCFVVPSIDRRTATKFINNINRSSFRARPDGVQLYGTREWLKFSELNNVFMNKYNFHFAEQTHLDYYSDEMIALNKGFRLKYKTDMSKIAVQAYDVVLHSCSDFFLSGERPMLIMNDINLEQVSEMDGYENSHVFIIEQEEFELIKVGSANGH